MFLSKHLNINIVIYVIAVIVAVGLFIVGDLHRLNKDFEHLYSLLRTARLNAFYDNTIIIVKFKGTVVTVTSQKDSKNMTTKISTITEVNYDTTMGNNTIVYDLRGTSKYNKRIHGGEIMLKSLLGFKRYIHVNCNGMVMEGRYPEDT